MAYLGSSYFGTSYFGTSYFSGSPPSPAPPDTGGVVVPGGGGNASTTGGDGGGGRIGWRVAYIAALRQELARRQEEARKRAKAPPKRLPRGVRKKIRRIVQKSVRLIEVRQASVERESIDLTVHLGGVEIGSRAIWVAEVETEAGVSTGWEQECLVEVATIGVQVVGCETEVGTQPVVPELGGITIHGYGKRRQRQLRDAAEMMMILGEM